MNWSPSSLTKSSTSTPLWAAVVTAYSNDSSGTKYGLVIEILFWAEYSSVLNIRRLFSVTKPGPLGTTCATRSSTDAGCGSAGVPLDATTAAAAGTVTPVRRSGTWSVSLYQSV